MRNLIAATKRGATALGAAKFGVLISVAAAGFAGTVHAGPTVVFEVETSRIVSAQDLDAAWYPASLTKLMTAYLVFDALKKESLTGAAALVISARANAQPKMRVGLGAGKQITVSEALAGLIIHSANDLAVALAETVSGSEEEFVAEMNEMALMLGMVRTRFANANGLPKDGQVTTARDMALLARALLRDFPQWSYLYAEESAQVGRKTVTTHNDVLKNFDGADGMKTGFTCGAGYNVVASATRGGRKIVAVVLGETSGRARTTRAEDLLEKAFSSPRPDAAAAVIDPPPLNGEMLTDMPLIVTPERAANVIKVRKCWPEPPVQSVAAVATDSASGAPDTGATSGTTLEPTSRVAQVVPPAPPVRPPTPSAPDASKPTIGGNPKPAGKSSKPLATDKSAKPKPDVKPKPDTGTAKASVKKPGT